MKSRDYGKGGLANVVFMDIFIERGWCNERLRLSNSCKVFSNGSWGWSGLWKHSLSMVTLVIQPLGEKWTLELGYFFFLGNPS
ncbi:MAG: hypothetical protein LVT47_15545 [Cyanobacteria bacterium LVE1205-1]|jgi:hypothetical protein